MALSMSDSARQVALSSRFILARGIRRPAASDGFRRIRQHPNTRQIQKSNDDIREDFLSRTRVLEQIRSDLYLSGTYVRDYLLEPESQKAEGHRLSLVQTRNDMDSELPKYKLCLTSRN